MKTLYININGETIKSDDNIEVIGSAEDAIMNSFYISLGMAVADGVTGIKYKPLVADFEKAKPDEFKSFSDQWQEVKSLLLGENPSGDYEFTLSSEYLDWLKMNATYSTIYYKKYQNQHQAIVNLNLDELYEDTLDAICRKTIRFLQANDNYKNYDKFVVNDSAVTRRSLLVRTIQSKYDNIAFVLYEKWMKSEDVSPHCGNRPCRCGTQKQFDYIYGFSEGLSLVCCNDKFGYVNTTGNLIIPCIYDFAGWFKDGIAPVCKNGQYGYIDKNGSIAISFMFDKADRILEGLALVKIKGVWKFIDKRGNEIINLPNEIEESDFSVQGFFNGFSCLRNKNGKWGAIDKSGKLIVPYQFDSPFFVDEKGAFSAALKYPRNWGIGNVKNEQIIQVDNCKIDSFSEGLAACKKNEKWGYIDRNGKTVIGYVFEEAKMFSEELAPVKKDGKWGYVDKMGILVISYTFDDAHCFSEGLAAVCLNNRWGFINKKGICIPCVFKWAESFNEGFARAKYNEFECIINKSGELVIPNGVNSLI